MTYDRTLIVIRERSFLDLLDLALLVVRDRPVVLGLTALAGIAPFAALNVWLLSAPITSGSLGSPLAHGNALGDRPVDARPGRLDVWSASSTGQDLEDARCLVPLAFRHAVPGPRSVFSGSARVCAGAGAVRFLNEVLLLERVGPFRAFGRSRAISRGFEGELFFRWLGQIALGLTFALCFQKGAETLGSVLAGGELTWEQAAQVDVGDLLFQAGVWIAIAFFAVVRFLSYIDRRIRLEGWEIELRLRASAAPWRRDSSDLPWRDCSCSWCRDGSGWAALPGFDVHEPSRGAALLFPPLSKGGFRGAGPGCKPDYMDVDASLEQPDQGGAQSRENIPGTIHAPTVSSRSGRSESRGWNGWVSASPRSFEGSASFSTVPFRRERSASGGACGLGRGQFDRHDPVAGGTRRVFCLYLHALDSPGGGGGRAVKPSGRGWAPPLGWATFPRGFGRTDADPWAEAKRRRAAGDLAGAVVCLFAHQLLTLDQMGLIRLAPGRTGRHYVQSLRDRELIDSLGATLRSVRGCLLRAEVAHRPGI